MTFTPSDQPVLHVDLAALTGNWRTFKAQVGNDIGATVKANAYGLGVEPVAKTLLKAGCSTFFVATLNEGLGLRQIAPKARIFVFSGIGTEDIPAFQEAQLTPVLNTLDEVQLWAAVSPAPGAALHVDTGMNRLGCAPSDITALAAAPDLVERAGLRILMSHLSCADTPEHPLNIAQQEAFKAIAAMFPQLSPSLSNSAGALNDVLAADLARPGIGLYGGNPRPALAMPLKPVIRLTAPVLQTRALSKGDSVGYGADFTAAYDMSVATLGIGYGDGLPRSVSGHGHVYLGDTPCAILGRVAMDSIVVDLGSAPVPKRGDHAEVIGRTSINEMARWASTISYEILTGLGQRVERRYSSV